MSKELNRLPVNLRKKAIREARNAAGMQKPAKKRRRRRRKLKASTESGQNNFERAEHNAMLSATSQQLQQILADYEELADVPVDCTPAELWGKIAIAEGHATTIYIHRDGLSTLKIVLHQRSPTIAQLKKTIASISVAEHKRQQRLQHMALRVVTEPNAAVPSEDDDDREHDVGRGQQVVSEAIVGRSNCELVNSALRNGHEHRALVSWRFLWRCFALYNVDTNQPIDDNDSNGRATLTALGIENGSNLKFVHRVKYFGRRRQS